MGINQYYSGYDSKPWLVLGDLNDFSPDEKRSFSKGNYTRYNNFINSINYKNHIDQVSRAILSLNTTSEKSIQRFSLDWIMRWPTNYGLGCTIPLTLNKPIIVFDHAPVLVVTYTRKFHKCSNFRFEAKCFWKTNFLNQLGLFGLPIPGDLPRFNSLGNKFTEIK